jgi:hypothetical protein
MITLQFVKGSGIGSSLIGWFGGGDFSHVDAVIGPTLIGARDNWIDSYPPGVQNRPIGYEKWKLQVQFDIPATETQQKMWEAFLRSQIGKPYDQKAIVGFIIGRDWQNESSWICSELQAAALQHCGIFGDLYLADSRITPNALALLVSGIPGTIWHRSEP